MTQDSLIVGVIAGAYGVHGEVRVKSFCAVPEAIETYAPLTDHTGRAYTLAVVRTAKGALITRIAEITTKEQADALKGTELLARRDQLPGLADDEFYHADLIDMDVVDTGGTGLGRIKAVQNNGADDLLEIVPAGGGETVLLPFTKAAVPVVDTAERRVVVDPPDGIF